MFRTSGKTGLFVSFAAIIGSVGASSLVLCVKATASEQSASEVHAQTANTGTPTGSRMRSQPDPIDFDDMTGWTSMFDGKTLNGWDGNPDVWKVVDGDLVGELPTPSAGSPPFRGTYLVWKGGEPADFEMKLEIKLEGARADSGIQFRAYVAPMPVGRPGMPSPDPREAKWNLGGYQFDLSLGPSQTTGLIGEVGGRGIIALPGQAVHTEVGKNPRLIGTLGDRDEFGIFKSNDWNQAYLIARGDTMIQIINGQVVSILIDDDSTKARSKGLIGLQYSGVPCKISFRNIRIRMIP